MNWLKSTRQKCEVFERILETNTDKKQFWEIAYEFMQSQDFKNEFNLNEVVGDFFKEVDSIQQLDPKSKFGEPPLTLYYSEKNSFVLDLYIWQEAHTSIHEHSFEGSFMVLQGSSIETVYNFDIHTKNAEGMLGNLNPVKMNYIHPGDIHPIPPKEKLIHRVLHLEKPTISLVLRTKGMKVVQYQFMARTLATTSFPEGNKIIKLRILDWMVKNKMPINMEISNELMWYKDFWNTLIANPFYNKTLKKLGYLFFDKNLKWFDGEYFFYLILNKIEDPQIKIIFTAYETWRDERAWSWIKDNLNIEKSRAIKLLVDQIEKTKISEQENWRELEFFKNLFVAN